MNPDDLNKNCIKFFKNIILMVNVKGSTSTKVRYLRQPVWKYFSKDQKKRSVYKAIDTKSNGKTGFKQSQSHPNKKPEPRFNSSTTPVKTRSNAKFSKEQGNSGKGKISFKGIKAVHNNSENLYRIEPQDAKDYPLILQSNVSSKDEKIRYRSVKPAFEQAPVPRLAHNLSRVLFQPGMYHQLQDTRSRVYNFTPFLQNIVKVEDFNFNMTGEFIPAGKDKTLLTMAQDINKNFERKANTNEQKVEFFSSTSSVTGVLSQIHYFLSKGRPPNMSSVPGFSKFPARFSPSALQAASVIVGVRERKNEELYCSIDADKSTDHDMILSILGHPLEKLLITEESEFSSFRRGQEELIAEKNKIDLPETYHFAKVGKFLLRSQLDCYDPRLPNSGTFDLKTRAVCAIRYDIDHIQTKMNNTNGYQIVKNFGTFESHEREKYDLLRSALLKYSFQARIGNMDGIFVCYHNIEKIFGFEYLPLTWIDQYFHYQVEESEPAKLPTDEELDSIKQSITHETESLASHMADTEFRLSFKLWEDILNQIVPGDLDIENGIQSSRLIVKAKTENNTSYLYVIHVGLDDQCVENIQNSADELNKLLLSQIEDETKKNDRNVTVKQKLDPQYFEQRIAAQKKCFKTVLDSTVGRVKGFRVSGELLFNGKKSTTQFPFPTSVDDVISLDYKFEELDSDEAQKLYRKYLGEKARTSWQKKSDGEGNDLTKVLRNLSDIGRLREEKWKSTDQEIVLWEPDSAFEDKEDFSKKFIRKDHIDYCK